MTPLRFTTDTSIEPATAVSVPAAYREELAAVLEIETGADGTVERAELDVEGLLDVLVRFSATERLEFGWRRREPAAEE